MSGTREIDDWVVPGQAQVDDWIVPNRAPTGLERAGRFIDNIGRGIAQGATFGFMDEIAAAARTGAGMWGDYGQALAEERARDAEFRQNNPIVSTVANVAGGIASPAARLGIFNPGRAGSLPGAMARGAGAGAAAGGVAGFGEGEGGLSDRVANAGTGAAVGAVVGGALPAVVEGARTAGGAVARRLGATSGNVDAERLLLRGLDRDGMTPEELLARSREAGAAPVAVADLGGENVANMGATVARLPGAARNDAARLVEQRGGLAQAGRLTEQVRRAVSGENYLATREELVTSRATAARPAYERAWRIQLTPDEYARVAPFVQDRIGQDAMQRGLRIMELEALAANRPFNPRDFGVQRTAEGWVPAEGATPNMRLMDAVKRGYDAIVESYRNQFGVLQLDEYGRAVNQVRATYRNTLAEMFPPYRRALETWSGPSQTLDALSMGRRLLSEGVDAADMTAQQIARLSPGDRAAFRIGVARGLMDRIEGAGDNADLTRLRQVFGTERTRARLRAAFGGDAEYGDFFRAMNNELMMARNNNMFSPRAGSPTMTLQEGAADLRAPPGGSPVVDAERASNNLPLARDLVQAGTGGGITAPLFRGIERFMDGRQQARLERNTAALGPMMFNPDQQAREEVARALIARSLADQRTQRVVNPAIRGLSRGAAVGGSLFVNE